MEGYSSPFLKWAKSVLRVRDVYPGPEFFHPVSRVKKIPDSDFFLFRIRIPDLGDKKSTESVVLDPQHGAKLCIISVSFGKKNGQNEVCTVPTVIFNI